MKKIHKQRIRMWVDALRSGKYKQARNALARKRRDGQIGHCCLDVAHCVYQKATGKGEHVEDLYNMGSFLVFKVGRTSTESTMHRKVADWFGLGDVDPELKDHKSYFLITAVDANDNCRYKFSTIANMIEETFLSESN